jgi:hypothetical protein
VIGGASGQSVAASANFCQPLNVTTDFQTSLLLKDTAPSAVTSTTTPDNVLIYTYYISTALSAAISAGATSASVSSASGLSVGDYIVIDNERVKITAISGTTLTITATQFAHSANVNVYFIKATPLTLMLQPTAATSPVDEGLGMPVSLGPGNYIVCYLNGDTANTRLVWATSMSVTAIQ